MFKRFVLIFLSFMVLNSCKTLSKHSESTPSSQKEAGNAFDTFETSGYGNEFDPEKIEKVVVIDPKSKNPKNIGFDEDQFSREDSTNFDGFDEEEEGPPALKPSQRSEEIGASNTMGARPQTGSVGADKISDSTTTQDKGPTNPAENTKDATTPETPIANEGAPSTPPISDTQDGQKDQGPQRGVDTSVIVVGVSGAALILGGIALAVLGRRSPHNIAKDSGDDLGSSSGGSSSGGSSSGGSKVPTQNPKYGGPYKHLKDPNIVSSQLLKREPVFINKNLQITVQPSVKFKPKSPHQKLSLVLTKNGRSHTVPVFSYQFKDFLGDFHKLLPTQKRTSTIIHIENFEQFFENNLLQIGASSTKGSELIVLGSKERQSVMNELVSMSDGRKEIQKVVSETENTIHVSTEFGNQKYIVKQLLTKTENGTSCTITITKPEEIANPTVKGGYIPIGQDFYSSLTKYIALRTEIRSEDVLLQKIDTPEGDTQLMVRNIHDEQFQQTFDVSSEDIVVDKNGNMYLEIKSKEDLEAGDGVASKKIEDENFIPHTGNEKSELRVQEISPAFEDFSSPIGMREFFQHLDNDVNGTVGYELSQAEINKYTNFLNQYKESFRYEVTPIKNSTELTLKITSKIDTGKLSFTGRFGEQLQSEAKENAFAYYLARMRAYGEPIIENGIPSESFLREVRRTKLASDVAKFLENEARQTYKGKHALNFPLQYFFEKMIKRTGKGEADIINIFNKKVQITAAFFNPELKGTLRNVNVEQFKLTAKASGLFSNEEIETYAIALQTSAIYAKNNAPIIVSEVLKSEWFAVEFILKYSYFLEKQKINLNRLRVDLLRSSPVRGVEVNTGFSDYLLEKSAHYASVTKMGKVKQQDPYSEEYIDRFVTYIAKKLYPKETQK